MYKENIVYFLYRKRRLDTKSEDAIGLEPMETPMSERKTNVYFDDSDGTTLICFKKDLITLYLLSIFKKKITWTHLWCLFLIQEHDVIFFLQKIILYLWMYWWDKTHSELFTCKFERLFRFFYVFRECSRQISSSIIPFLTDNLWYNVIVLIL